MTLWPPFYLLFEFDNVKLWTVINSFYVEWYKHVYIDLGKLSVIQRFQYSMVGLFEMFKRTDLCVTRHSIKIRVNIFVWVVY